MKTLTEQEIVSRAPIKVTLGDKQFDIHLLRSGKSVAWRDKLRNVAVELMKGPAAEESFLGGFEFGLSKVLIEMPEKIREMILDYAPNLTNEILDEATDHQIRLVFSEIFDLAYPHLAELGRLKSIARTSGH